MFLSFLICSLILLSSSLEAKSSKITICYDNWGFTRGYSRNPNTPTRPAPGQSNQDFYDQHYKSGSFMRPNIGFIKKGNFLYGYMAATYLKGDGAFGGLRNDHNSAKADVERRTIQKCRLDFPGSDCITRNKRIQARVQATDGYELYYCYEAKIRID